jgi:hypothetical protein
VNTSFKSLAKPDDLKRKQHESAKPKTKEVIREVINQRTLQFNPNNFTSSPYCKP